MSINISEPYRIPDNRIRSVITPAKNKAGHNVYHINFENHVVNVVDKTNRVSLEIWNDDYHFFVGRSRIVQEIDAWKSPKEQIKVNREIPFKWCGEKEIIFEPAGKNKIRIKTAKESFIICLPTQKSTVTAMPEENMEDAPPPSIELGNTAITDTTGKVKKVQWGTEEKILIDRTEILIRNEQGQQVPFNWGAFKKVSVSQDLSDGRIFIVADGTAYEFYFKKRTPSSGKMILIPFTALATLEIPKVAPKAPRIGADRRLRPEIEEPPEGMFAPIRLESECSLQLSGDVNVRRTLPKKDENDRSNSENVQPLDS